MEKGDSSAENAFVTRVCLVTGVNEPLHGDSFFLNGIFPFFYLKKKDICAVFF